MPEQCGGQARYHLLRGQALNVTHEFSPEAEQELTRAIKLDPKLVIAWDALGEAFWKKGDKEQRQVVTFCFWRETWVILAFDPVLSV